MIKVKFSEGYWAQRKRIQRLPRLVENELETYAKKNAQALVTMFHDKIKGDKFGLERLQPDTIREKMAAGYEFPYSPLYALGDQSPKDTYANMLEVVKVGKSFRVRVKDVNHAPREGQEPVSLKTLFRVHEYGTTIFNGFGRGILIRIPPRPAFFYAYRDLMDRLRRKEPSKVVRMAMYEFVRKGKDFLYAMIKLRE